MAKVKALYHFLDTVACKNRLQGEEFVVTEERATALLKSGAVVIVGGQAEKYVEEPPRKKTKSKSERC